ncbi:hypothetical protein PT276_05255 [Orbaceae bacterium ESL0721]|nr:hypothetical protein [Orbaceae bacterium ESL0721]
MTKSITHWSLIKERKGLLGLKFILLVYRLFGYKIVKIFMLPVITFFWLTGKVQRKASQNYLKRLKEYCQQTDQTIPWVAKRYLTSWHHFWKFGDSLLDKIACWHGDINFSSIYYPQKQEITDYIKKKRGTLLIGSHLGNIELCRALAELSKTITINALVFTTNAKRFNQLLHQVNAQSSINLIQVDEITPNTAILLKQKIENGEWVAIVGDRTSANNQLRQQNGSIIWSDFLGYQAPFATGPFILASLLACPVYLIWGIKPNGRFQLYFEHFADKIDLPRKERKMVLKQYIEKYSQRLQHYCLISPLDWFNFFDFWAAPYPKTIEESQVTKKDN